MDFLLNHELIDEIEYPIYHLDFEAFQSPLPRFKGEKPYMQSVFQYSIHIQRKPFVCDEKLDNYYYIPNDFSDHRKELVEKMIKTIDSQENLTVLEAMVEDLIVEDGKMIHVFNVLVHINQLMENVQKIKQRIRQKVVLRYILKHFVYLEG